MSALRDILNTQWRILTLRSVRPAMDRYRNAYLAYCMVVSLLVGAGRYWDNDRGLPFQKMGVGSFIYIFVFSAVFWLMLKPLRPKHWTYLNVLVFVGMTALPGLLYAIPVERFMTMDAAQTTNVWFLAVVALWRLLMLFSYLIRSAGLKIWEVLVASLFPLTLIIITLSILNLGHVVFDFMAGIPEDQQTPNDASYIIVAIISYLAFLASPILLGGYVAVILSKRKKGRASEEVEEDTSPDLAQH